MTTEKQIQDYIASLPETKRTEMQELHTLISALSPSDKLWFLDGKDDQGKTVSNPNIGYGTHTLKYANGKTKEFYRIGISANTAGISIYFFGIDDKTYLSRTYSSLIGKAGITGYCIKFKSLNDLNREILETVIRDSFATKK